MSGTGSQASAGGSPNIMDMLNNMGPSPGGTEIPVPLRSISDFFLRLFSNYLDFLFLSHFLSIKAWVGAK